MLYNAYYGFSAIPATSKVLSNFVHPDPTLQPTNANNVISTTLKTNKQFFIEWYDNATRSLIESWAVDGSGSKPEILLYRGTGTLLKAFEAKYAANYSILFSASTTSTDAAAAAAAAAAKATADKAAADAAAAQAKAAADKAAADKAAAGAGAAPATSSSSMPGSTMLVLGVLAAAGAYMWWSK